MKFVVDASVAVKWLFPEVYGDAARRILKRARDILAPDLIWAEVASAACKKIRRSEVSWEEASRLFGEFQNYPVQAIETKTLMEMALKVAHDSGVSVYDAAYLSLSYKHDCPLVTADRKLYDRVHEAYPQSETLWLPDIH